MSHYHYFENLFIPYGDETLILTGHAQFETDYRGTDSDNQRYARFVLSKVTDLHRVTDLDTEQQGYTEADMRHFEKLAVEELNRDKDLCDWLPSTI
ncbi:hypothetical protein UFOVP157_33 [uncultured Caudovirales phage]|uniref:Uncharacterized protein n=1 Tax=uncultured Caudovirales phage TaxID=2100421 RepID=A0A6J7WEL7_9CAUD|nr:hypothetical protein UFOVP157_33 [uncultured Caudovirales phage]